MFDLDLRSRQPIYEQLIENLKKLIITGALKTDEQLPSVRHLATQLTINPNTIQKAYRELEQQGYTYSLPGKGSFVSSLPETGNAEKLKELKDQLRIILTESCYLGMNKEQLLQLFEEIEQAVKRSDSHA